MNSNMHRKLCAIVEFCIDNGQLDCCGIDSLESEVTYDEFCLYVDAFEIEIKKALHEKNYDKHGIFRGSLYCGALNSLLHTESNPPIEFVDLVLWCLVDELDYVYNKNERRIGLK